MCSKKKQKKIDRTRTEQLVRWKQAAVWDLLFRAYTCTVFTNSPQQTPQLDRHVSKLWGGWVYSIRKGTMVSSPKYRCLASWRSRFHEMETASASYWPHTHAWPRSTRRVYRDTWPIANHYRAVSCFHLSLSLTFRIIGFEKREEGMKTLLLPIHVELPLCFAQILETYPMGSVALSLLRFTSLGVFRRWHVYLPLRPERDVGCTLFAEESHRSDEWGNFWMPAFVQLRKVQNITRFKGVRG